MPEAGLTVAVKAAFLVQPHSVSFILLVTTSQRKESSMNGLPPHEEHNYHDESAPLLRKVIAKRMLESKTTAPHFYLTVSVDMQKVIDLRSKYNADGKWKISFNDIIIKAVALTLAGHPECNVSYVDDMIRYYHTIDISLAVAIDGGLLVPVIRNCEKKSVFEINEEATVLIEKARTRKLRPREGMGGSFTLSNLGMFGIEEFIAILNPPQAMILAVAAIRELPVVSEGTLAVGKRMTMTLSSDHRALDGAMSARFLQDLKVILENPEERIG
jgi:pyruvate dehydrogenase E2 component (dihydrolipoamide acetyltransferase)